MAAASVPLLRCNDRANQSISDDGSATPTPKISRLGRGQWSSQNVCGFLGYTSNLLRAEGLYAD